MTDKQSKGLTLLPEGLVDIIIDDVEQGRAVLSLSRYSMYLTRRARGERTEDWGQGYATALQSVVWGGVP